MTSEALTLALYLVICGNFILGLVIINPIMQWGLKENFINLLLILYFYTFLMLFELGTLFYFSAIKKIYKKNEIKFIGWTLTIGLFIGSYISYRYIGLSDTLQWAIPTGVSLILFYALRKMGLKDLPP